MELPDHLSLPNLTGLSATAENPNAQNDGKVRSYHFVGRDASNSWHSVIPWVKANTKLEIWLKGSEFYCRSSLNVPPPPPLSS